METPTFEEAGRAWFADVVSLNRPANTLRRYDDQLRIRLYPALGAKPITDITRKELQLILRALVEQRRWSCARAMRTVMISVFDFALEQEWIGVNPARSTSPIRTPTKEVTVPTDQQVNALRKAAVAWQSDPRATMPVRLMMDVTLGAAGLRIGELLALQWQDINLESNPPTVTVTGTAVESPIGDTAWSKGRHRQNNPKTASSRRAIPIPTWLVEKLAVRRQADGLVFHTATGGLYSQANVHARWRAIAELAGVKGVTPHSLRRYACTAVAGDFNIDTASKLMGHSSILVTERHYVARAPIAPDVRSTLDRFALDDS